MSSEKGRSSYFFLKILGAVAEREDGFTLNEIINNMRRTTRNVPTRQKVMQALNYGIKEQILKINHGIFSIDPNCSTDSKNKNQHTKRPRRDKSSEASVCSHSDGTCSSATSCTSNASSRSRSTSRKRKSPKRKAEKPKKGTKRKRKSKVQNSKKPSPQPESKPTPEPQPKPEPSTNQKTAEVERRHSKKAQKGPTGRQHQHHMDDECNSSEMSHINCNEDCICNLKRDIEEYDSDERPPDNYIN